MNGARMSLAMLVALACGTGGAAAAPVLGPDLATFAVLGATPSVTNVNATILVGDVGVSPAASITGQSTLTVNGVNALLNPGDVHLNDATAIAAQAQLAGAIANLGLLGAGSLLPADLAGLSLAPGVYTVPAGVSNLTTTLTLDGAGNANAAWVFQVSSTLITSAGSAINVINTGAGAGVYWNVGSSATLGATTSFEGNILALASVTLGGGATIGCGRALAQTATVTMDNNTIDALDCTGTGEEGSGGLSGGLDVSTTANGTQVAFLPFAPIGSAEIPEPGALLLLGAGLASLLACGRRKSAGSA